jgi:hypothetical protein
MDGGRGQLVHHRPASIVHRRSSILHRRLAATLIAGLFCSAPAAGQERLRIAADVSQQASTTTVSQAQTFDRYFEQGTFTFERPIPQSVAYGGGAMVRVWRALYAGGAVSVFTQTDVGSLTARVPHPLQFNKLRTITGDVADARRSEIGQHIMVGWAIPASRGLDFLVSAGPSIITAEQLFVTRLDLSLAQEVFPYDDLAFPRVDTETLRENVIGYNAGVDMTWRLNRRVGVGLLVRYSSGKKEFTPTGGAPVEVTVGGLHAGGGVRLLFNSFGSSRRKPVPPPKPPPSKQPPAKQPPAQPPKGK